MSEPVDWDVAARIGARLSGREPFSESYHADALAPDFEVLTARAEELVTAETGLIPATGAARGRVIDRPQWIAANVASFQRLLGPLTHKIGDQLGSGPAAAVTRKVAGAEVGAVLGWMSRRVLGQYDLLVVEEEDPTDQDLVYYVGPNILGIEKRHDFPRSQFRLWLALHEVTHRAQFTGVPWLRGYFLGLVHELVDNVEPDPDRFFEALKRLRDGADRRERLAEGGLSALFASDEQREVMGRIGGLMSVLEGHGDLTMERAGAGLLPSAPRFHRVLHDRRQKGSPFQKMVQRLLGLEAKLAQYEQGEAFLRAIEERRGRSAVDLLWEGPEQLPTLAEVRDPDTWLDRVAPPGGRLRLIVAGEARVRLDELLGRCRFAPPDTAVTCAVSGGADSLALLVLAVEAGGDVTAVHVDHGLREGSDAEADVVAAAAARFGARFRSERVAVEPGPNLEARARAARLGVLPGRRAHRPHRRRPGRDGAARSRPGGRARRVGRHRPGPAAPPRPAASRDGRPL